MSKMGSGQRERGYLLAPRIQVVLTPVEEAKPDATEVAGPFDAWLVLYAPDGGDPVTVKMAGGPFDSLGALHLIDAVYNDHWREVRTRGCPGRGGGT